MLIISKPKEIINIRNTYLIIANDIGHHRCIKAIDISNCLNNKFKIIVKYSEDIISILKKDQYGSSEIFIELVLTSSINDFINQLAWHLRARLGIKLPQDYNLISCIISFNKPNEVYDPRIKR